MATIEVDFDVYKALMMKRRSEDVTFNDVLREMLNLAPMSFPIIMGPGPGVVYKGVHFPEGTLFRATYKGRTYTAQVKGGQWVSEEGQARKSPSEAAVRITLNNVNGWRFWEAKRPGETEWKLLENFRQPTMAEMLA